MRAYIKAAPVFKKGSPVTGTGPLPRQVIRLADPAPRLARDIDLRPDADACAALAGELGITSVRKLRLSGRLAPLGRTDWTLTATLGATVVQPCVVTLAPVTTRIEEEVRRRYVATLPDLAPGEVEMPDDEVEEMPATLDLTAVLAEALALALPQWPRAEGAALPPAADDPALRPFAGLDRLLGRDESGEG